MDVRFTLIGLIIGFLIGLTGMGGGSLMTPVMILIMGVKPIVAVGTDLAYGAITKIVGGAAHWRQGSVNMKVALLVAAGSLPATILGVGLTTAIKRTHPALVDEFLLRALGCTLIIVAIVLLLKSVLTEIASRMSTRRPPKIRGALVDLGDRKPWLLPIIGAVVGFLVGLTSVGSGTLVIISLLFLYPRWESKDWVGTDVFHASILVSGASLAQWAVGNVNFGMVGSLLLGSIPGVLAGSRLAVDFSERYLRFGLAGVLLLSGIKLV